MRTQVDAGHCALDRNPPPSMNHYSWFVFLPQSPQLRMDTTVHPIFLRNLIKLTIKPFSSLLLQQLCAAALYSLHFAPWLLLLHSIFVPLRSQFW